MDHLDVPSDVFLIGCLLSRFVSCLAFLPPFAHKSPEKVDPTDRFLLLFCWEGRFCWLIVALAGCCFVCGSHKLFDSGDELLLDYGVCLKVYKETLELDEEEFPVGSALGAQEEVVRCFGGLA